MAASQILPTDPASAPREGYVRGHSLFVPTTEQIDPAKIRAFAGEMSNYGHDMSYARYPNGYLFDILPDFSGDAPRGATPEALHDAYQAALAKDIAGQPKVLAHDYSSVYTPAAEYEAARAQLTQRMKDDFIKQATQSGTDEAVARAVAEGSSLPADLARGSRKAWDTYQKRLGHLADAESEFQALANRIEDANMAYVQKVRARFAKADKKEGKAEGGPVNYAEGGKVNFADGGAVQAAPAQSAEERVGETAADVANLIQEGDMDQRKLAYLIRMASTGTIAPDKAYEFAEEILAQNVPALMQRFARYPRAIRILARVDLALGGLGGQALGLVGNQKIRNEPVGADGYAKGGAVKKKKSAKRMPYQGDEQAFQAFADFAIEEYGPQLGGNMAKRAEGNAAKLLFALQQQEKNSAESPEQYREKITMLNQMGRQFNINPKAAFNRTTDAMDTKRELASILKSDHKINPAFQAALQRMDRLVGSR
jgi:hypothetical protein